MISAYIILHEDDDFLELAIDSINKYVDEIVVVDGAYEWIAPFLSLSGINPEKSSNKTLDILSKYGNKVRYFSGTWRDELHKREFGFEQCQGDIVWRFDADEVYQVDETQLDSFIKGNYSVAQMEFPMMLTHNLHRQRIGDPNVPCQSFLFKKPQIDSEHHCAYLWLVLTPEEQERRSKPKWTNLYLPPLARVAHLTSFRTPKTSVNRARFYTLLYTRSTGHIAWEIPNSRESSTSDALLNDMLNHLGPSGYSAYLRGHDIVASFPDMSDFYLDKIEFSPKISEIVSLAYESFLKEIDVMQMATESPIMAVNGIYTNYDLTTVIRQHHTSLRFEFADQVNGSIANIKKLPKQSTPNKPQIEVIEIKPHFDGKFIDIDLSGIDPADSHQYSLQLAQWFDPNVKASSLIKVYNA